MVYIYKKTVGNKIYYYLRISERKGKKVIARDIAYLGGSIAKVRKALDNLKQYKKEIRKAHRTIQNFLESNYYLEKAAKLKLKKDPFLGDKLEEVESCKIHYSKTFQKLDELTKKELLNNFTIEFSYNSTSIEGNTITLKEAKDLLEEGLTPKGKTLREIYDIQNTKKVFFEILELNKEITSRLIIELHSKLLENIDTRVGGFRTKDIKVTGSTFKATPAPYIKADMELLLKWYKENKKKLHPLAIATLFHHKFERIHPFFDGNGRTGRMIMNYMLIRAGHPPIIIHKKSRMEYLEALRNADKSKITSQNTNDFSELVQYVANEMTSSYWDIFL